MPVVISLHPTDERGREILDELQRETMTPEEVVDAGTRPLPPQRSGCRRQRLRFGARQDRLGLAWSRHERDADV